MHLIPVNHHQKRQSDSTTIEGFEGTVVASASPTNSDLILATGAPTAVSISAPPIADSFTLTVTTGSASSTSSPTPSTSQSPQTGAMKSSISTPTVIAACVGSFIGLAILICVFIWWSRGPTSKSRGTPRSPVSENRNVRGAVDQNRTRSGAWDKLEDDRWEGMDVPKGPSLPRPERQMSQEEIDEKNFSMFKARTPSMRTTRTARALEEHGFDMPPMDFSKYHPNLAEELALTEPSRPYAGRQDSGVSWDSDTVRDDSFLSLKSVRVESGTMSPTMVMAKTTPPAQAALAQDHRWESAEVITGDESQNPFADVTEESRRVNSSNNPFFSAGDLHRSTSRRSRSNSRGSRRSASRARSMTRSRVVSSSEDPFADMPIPDIDPLATPHFPTHSHSDSIASGYSSAAFGSERAMKSLIAALDLSQEEVEDRLRIADTLPTPSTASRYSAMTTNTVYTMNDDGDIGTARYMPPTPQTPRQLQNLGDRFA